MPVGIAQRFKHRFVSPAVQGVPRGPVTFGHRQPFLVPAMSGDTSFYSWQVLSPLLGAIGQKPFYSRPIAGAYRYRLVIEALDTFRFLETEVAFATLGPHEFAAAGDMEAALCALVSFDFWQFKFTLPLPLLSSSGQPPVIV